MFLAVLLDREMRGTRIYQTIFYLPVVLSLAVIGIIWQLQYAPEQGFINNVLGRTSNDNLIDWLGDPSLNLWAALVATSWRHVGYIMVLYLAGLKSFDPALREAAKVDGASERQTFLRVVFRSCGRSTWSSSSRRSRPSGRSISPTSSTAARTASSCCRR